MRRVDRLDKYLSHKGITEYRATKDAGLSKGTITKSREENRDLSNKTVEKLVEVYSDLNRVWLLTGEGEMLKNVALAENQAVALAADEIKDNKISVNTDQTIALLVAELSAQRRLAEKIIDQNGEILLQNRELLAMVKDK